MEKGNANGERLKPRKDAAKKTSPPVTSDGNGDRFLRFSWGQYEKEQKKLFLFKNERKINELEKQISALDEEISELYETIINLEKHRITFKGCKLKHSPKLLEGNLIQTKKN